MQSAPRVVIFLGPPGSGKGTQAVRVSKALSVPHISTGDLFRENVKNETELGKKVKAIMAEGKFAPDELVLEMLFDRVSRPDCARGYILDGCPRTLAQAEALKKHFGRQFDVVVLDLQVPDEVIIKRVEGRLTCVACGHIHNRYFSPPLRQDVCDWCQGKVVQRPDDRAEVVVERLRVYHDQTEPLIAYYEKQGNIHHYDGTQPPDTVFDELMKTLK